MKEVLITIDALTKYMSIDNYIKFINDIKKTNQTFNFSVFKQA